MNRLAFAFFASFAVMAFFSGCGRPATDPAVLAEHRTALVLSEEPDDAQTVLEIRNAMYGVDADAEAEHAHDEEHSHADESSDEHEGHEHAEHEHGSDEAAHEHEEHAAEAEAHADHEHEAGHDHEHADEHDHDHAHADHDHAGHVHADEPEPLHSEMDVVMVGTVGGVPNPSTQSHPEFPFTRGKALFFIADPQAAAELEEHAHQHAPGEECAFCAANAGDPAKLVAAVQFRDKGGKPLPIDARELFDLKEKELVVVRGKATIGPGGMLVVDADGLFIRR